MRRNVIDRMALLCTLHADGPRTLRLLREAGCTSIDKLGPLSADKLGVLLGIPPAAARRLKREAEVLLERLEPVLELEEVTYPAAAGSLATKPPPKGFQLEESGGVIDDDGDNGTDEDDEVDGRRTSRTDLDVRDRALLDEVVQRWRREETTAAPRSIDSPRDGGYDPNLTEVEICGGAIRDVGPSAMALLRNVPEHAPQEGTSVQSNSGDRLRVGALPGLDAATHATLEAAGIRSLEELATCPIDELVTCSGLAFTRSRTLQFWAGKRLSELPHKAQSSHKTQSSSKTQSSDKHAPEEFDPLPKERFSPREAPPLLEPALDRPETWLRKYPDDGGVAGPFA